MANEKLGLVNLSTGSRVPDADAMYVRQGTAGVPVAETLYGVKTFNSFPVGPSSAPSNNYEFVNKKYVDDTSGGAGIWSHTGGVISAAVGGETLNPAALPVGGTWTLTADLLVTGAYAFCTRTSAAGAASSAGDRFHGSGIAGDVYSFVSIDGPGSVDRGFGINQDGIWKWAIGSDHATSETMYIAQTGVDTAINNLLLSFNGSATINDCGIASHRGALSVGPQFFESVQTYLATTYADVTAEARTNGGTAFTLVDYDGDYIYFGRDIPFNTAFFDISTSATIQSYCIAEYSTGSGWQQTPSLTDGTLGFYRNGALAWNKGLFSPVWATQAVNGVTKYWIRVTNRWPRKGTITSPSGQLQAPGTNYTTGDIVRINDGDGTVHLVLTATAGAVTGWAMLSGSAVYSTGVKNTTALTGVGSGLQLSVTSVAPSGTGRVRTLNGTVAAGGTNYVVGDRVAIVSGGGTNDAYVRVSTVTTGGVVTAVDMGNAQGTGYTAGIKPTINVTVTNPLASGFTILLNAVSNSATCNSINPTSSMVFNAYACAGDSVPFFSLDASGRILISDPSGTSRVGKQLPGLSTTRVEMTGTASDRSDFLMATASTSGGVGSQLLFAKSTSTTLEAPGAVSSNHLLGAIEAYAYSAGTTASFVASCGIKFYADSAPSGSRAPARIHFYTTSTTVAEREIFRMNMDGRLIAATTGYEDLVTADNDIPNRKYVERKTTPSSGVVAPSSTPTKIGDIYVDTVALKLYVSAGIVSSADWIRIN